MRSIIRSLIILALPIAVLWSCTDDDNSEGKNVQDTFNRQMMLTGIADEIIIPSFEHYVSKLEGFRVAGDQFSLEASMPTLEQLRLTYLSAYKAWQHVSMFDIGKAEETKLRNYTNIYPTDPNVIEGNISNQNYNLLLPSNYVAQGFPALDYLLYGVGQNDADILSILESNAYRSYLSELINRLHDIGKDVLDDWKSEFRTTFINNNGSSATASVDKLVNDYLFYYEKFFRAGKIGIPAGVFSGTPISTSVEAPYSNRYSKELFQESFVAVQNLFRGISFDGSTTVSSLEDYLQHIQELNQTEDVAQKILDQWSLAEAQVNSLSNSFKEQVETDNIKMLEVYDEIQRAVVLLKVDMLCSFNIQVDYIDADGD